MKTLRDVKIGQTAVIKRLHGEGALKRRIMDMGLTKGTEVYVRKVAPLGDPRLRTERAQGRRGTDRSRVTAWITPIS